MQKKIIIYWFIKSKIDTAFWSMGTFQNYHDGAYGLINRSLKPLAVSISNRQIHVWDKIYAPGSPPRQNLLFNQKCFENTITMITVIGEQLASETASAWAASVINYSDNIHIFAQTEGRFSSPITLKHPAKNSRSGPFKKLLTVRPLARRSQTAASGHVP